MNDFIEIRVDNEELQRALNQLTQKTSNLRPLMRNIAGILEDSVEENFDKEGRSDKWTLLAKSTIKQRTKKGYWPGKILQMRGELAASITSKYDDNSATVGTNKVYAAIHQFGGNAGKNKKVKILARPYLKIGNKESDQIIFLIQGYLK
ncbi:MAG: phage virion morphogenesis protein [Candidatus Melainabacteria bacterium RIFOXYA12_FULL_32_12]|nr:MAG: phage virion morphogenesis protein [Candidatus Melainabacteria bacterium RIFOXYA12_FULL_32_12]